MPHAKPEIQEKGEDVFIIIFASKRAILMDILRRERGEELLAPGSYAFEPVRWREERKTKREVQKKGKKISCNTYGSPVVPDPSTRHAE